MIHDRLDDGDDDEVISKGKVAISERRHEELTTKAALAEEYDEKNEQLKREIKRREEQIESANRAYTAALADEGPHSEAFYEDVPLQQKRIELARLRGEDLAALAQYNSGDVVSYGQGEKKTGVVIEVLTSNTTVPKGGDDKEVEASQDSPKYVVALGHSDGVDVFSGSDLSSGEINIDDLDSSTEDLKDDSSGGGQAANAASDEQAALDFRYPRSWRKSSKPNRLILLDAWSSMGGTFSACYPRYGGKRFCAAFKDKVYGTTRWREGGG